MCLQQNLLFYSTMRKCFIKRAKIGHEIHESNGMLLIEIIKE